MYKSKLRIHIIPLGFEIDRVVEPLKVMKADRAWLISKEEHNDKAMPYKEKIVAKLKKLKIEHASAYCDITDLYDMLRAMRLIIEKEHNNDIFINVSAGSKIAAIAGMMAAMMFKNGTQITPYYAEPEKYTGEPKNIKPLSEGLKEIQKLPEYNIKKPDDHLISLLKLIHKHGDKVSKRDLIEDAKKEKLIAVGGETKNKKQSEYMSLNKVYLEPLISWGLIRVEKVGRHRKIELTDKGQNMLKFLA